MSSERVAMPEQSPKVRATNFDEVALGYSESDAAAEAARCLNCKNPRCVTGCPVNVHIPEFISHIKQGDYEGAYQAIRLTNSLPAVCGRVCPQESQCESKCVLGIKGQSVAIGRLERFAADRHMAGEHEVECPPSNGVRVAVVGAGPSGLTCAGDLRRLGYDVTVFEALHAPGGVLIYGIPEFRLPKDLVRREVDTLERMGVNVRLNQVIGRTHTIDELFENGFKAVFIGSGAGLPNFMRVPGEDLNGVYSANEYLTRINLMKAYKPGAHTPIMHAKRAAIIGGGNVAMDAARCALRMGAQSYIVYRRGFEEMPARREEIHHAREEGVEFMNLVAPLEVLGDEKGWVRGLKAIRCELGEPDASGRRRPVELPGTEFVLDVDMVIVAIGTSPNPLIASTTPGLETNRKGCLIVREDSLRTSREAVWAGGDAVTGAATVILAMGAGKQAAREIDEYLKGK